MSAVIKYVEPDSIAEELGLEPGDTILEINDTENKDIERILVFLKPSASDVAVMNTRAEATKILQDLEVKKTNRFYASKKLWGWIGAVLLVAAVIFAMTI